MTETPLHIAIVGHTNVGKTSLMRTLTRSRDFGEVSSRPATTRHVEMAELAIGGAPVLRLYDTPGLEDSSGLLGHLDHVRQRQGNDWLAAIDSLGREGSEGSKFAQEAKALSQVRQADIALYVIDVRDQVRARHRDELEILGRCAKPVLPVLNFIKAPDARMNDWREALARVNMHAVIIFDTVVYDEADELELYKKIAILADKAAPAIERLTAELMSRRRQRHRAASGLVADLLIDVAAAEYSYSLDDEDARQHVTDTLRDKVRTREKETVSALLALLEFSPDDYRLDDFPISDGAWRDDLFDPDMLARMGLSAGKAAATGAAAGVAVDLMVGGLTLGAAAATGATIGFAIDTARKHGSAIMNRLGGRGRLRVDDGTLILLGARQVWLISALMKRGHGATARLEDKDSPEKKTGEDLLAIARKARGEARWSRLNVGKGKVNSGSARLVDLRRRLRDKIADLSR